jgi:anti-anti-sigma factor
MTRSTIQRGPTRMQMHITPCSDKKTLICALVGDLDRHSFADFAARVASWIRPGVHIAFDLSNVGFIDSTGLRTLRATAWRIRRGGGQVSAKNLPTQVADMFLVSGMDTVMSMGRSQDVNWWPPPVA